MENKVARRGFTQKAVYKNSHSRESLSGIYNASDCQTKQKTLLNGCVEDPQLRPLGMTTLLTSGQDLTYKNCSAFTLIELLVVVLIIGILVAVAVPQYQVAVQRSQYATMKNLVKSVANAQEVYYLANGEYADSFEKLDVELSGYDENESTDTKLVYPWGNCETGASGQVLCFYQFSDFGTQYQIACTHSTAKWQDVSYAGKTMCVGNLDASSKRSRFCQRETGKSVPDLIGGGFSLYYYN